MLFRYDSTGYGKPLINALRSKSGSYAQAFGRKEKAALPAIYDPSELGSGTTKFLCSELVTFRRSVQDDKNEREFVLTNGNVV